MKLIVGIIAHDADEYVRRAQKISRWSYRDMESYYIKFGSEPTEKIVENVYYAPGLHDETVETGIIKVLYFMKFALTKEWDFMLRTNLSSIFHWGRVFDMLKQYKNFPVIGNIVNNDFVTGCGMFLSRRVVQGIVDTWIGGEHIELTYDDIVIGQLIKKSGFPMSTWKHTEYLMARPNMDPRTADNYFHIRCKLSTDVMTRVQYEIPMMERFTNHLGVVPLNLILVHYGQHFPEYIQDCVHQIKKYNPTIEVHLLLENFNHIDGAKVVTLDRIPKSSTHIKFNQVSKLDREFRGGFWHAAAERFMAISDYMKHNQMSDVFHIEYDNLIYMDLSKLFPLFQKHYKHIAIPTDCPGRVIPSFMYFRDVESVQHLTEFMVDNVPKFTTEMQLLKAYMYTFPERMKALPIARPPFVSSEYTNHWDEFQCVFDAAALGQYIGGIDAPGNTEGFVNESCVFRADKVDIEWRDGRPWAFGLPVVNLHIHCKNLKKWST
jgi:hypothetical protein